MTGLVQREVNENERYKIILIKNRTGYAGLRNQGFL